MNRLLVISIILPSILLLSLLGIRNLHQVQTEITDSLEQAEQLISQKDFSSASKQVQEISRQWEKDHKILDTYVHHNLPEQISRNFSKLNAALSSQNIDDAQQLLAEIKSCLNQLYHNELPTLDNLL